MNAKEAIRILKSGVPYYAFDVANVIRFIEEQERDNLECEEKKI